MPDDPAITEPQGEPIAHAEASTETEARAKQKKTTEPQSIPEATMGNDNETTIFCRGSSPTHPRMENISRSGTPPHSE